MNGRDDFMEELFQTINQAYREGVPMTEVYGALGLAQVKMEDDIKTAMDEERETTNSSFKLGDDEELF